MLKSIHGVIASSASQGLSWDLSGPPVYNGVSLFTGGIDSGMVDSFFRPDGTSIFMLGTGSDTIYQYNMSTPWLLSSVSVGSSVFIGAEDTSPTGIFLSSDGTKVYLIGVQFQRIKQYPLTIAWDLSSIQLGSVVSFDVSSDETSPSGLFFRGDGTSVYIVGTSSDTVYQYNLNTPWDVTTVAGGVAAGSISVSTQAPVSGDLTFSSDGTKMFVLENILSGQSVFQYTLSTPWLITSATYDSVAFVVGTQTSNPLGLTFRVNGQTMYVTDLGTDRIYEYDV